MTKHVSSSLPLARPLVRVEIKHLDLGEVALSGIVGPEAAVAHHQTLKAQPDDYAPATKSQLEAGFGVPATLYVRLQRLRWHLSINFMSAMKGLDVLLSPTVAWSAPNEDPSIMSDKGLHEGRRSVPYNLVGFPALSIPCGFDRHGLPIGLQIASRPGEDELLLGAGAAIEDTLSVGDLGPSLPS